MTAKVTHSTSPVPDNAKTAFVLAGGGSFGSVQVGMLRALVAHGLMANMVVGSSVGAMNAAFYAGMPTAEGVERLAGIWRSLRRQDVFPITWRTMLGFIRRRDCLIAADGVRRLIDTHVPYRNLEDAKLPLHVVTTDLLSGGTIVLSKGPVAQAIVASTAIPAAFAPVQLENLYLADGAITCNTPVRVAVALGARRLFVLPTGYACALEAPPRGAIACALHALTLLIARQLLHELHGLESGIEYFVIPPLCPLRGSPGDFSQTNELIKSAAESTRTWLAEGGLTRCCEIPQQMHAHNHHQLLQLSDGLCIRPGSAAALIASGHRNHRQSTFQSGAAILEK
jgi:NTE family protein